MRWRSTCWVYASDLKDKGIFEKYSWAVLKAWSETIAAGAHSPPAPAQLCFQTPGALQSFVHPA